MSTPPHGACPDECSSEPRPNGCLMSKNAKAREMKRLKMMRVLKYFIRNVLTIARDVECSGVLSVY